MFTQEDANELFRSMPDAERKAFADMIQQRMTDIIENPTERKMIEVMTKDNPCAKKAFEDACTHYDLNTIVLQCIGNIKKIVENIDENNLTLVNFMDNLKTFKQIGIIYGMAVNNVKPIMQRIDGDRDAGTGQAST